MTTPEPGPFAPPTAPPTAPPDAPAAGPLVTPPAAYAAPQPFGYAPVAPNPARLGSPGAAVAVGFAAMIAGALLYGFVMKSMDSQWSFFALALALAVALALGKVGGPHPALPVLGVLLSLLGVFLGQLFFIYLVLHQEYGLGPGDVFGSELGDTLRGWWGVLDFKDALFYGIAGFEGYVLTRRFGAGD